MPSTCSPAVLRSAAPKSAVSGRTDGWSRGPREWKKPLPDQRRRSDSRCFESCTANDGCTGTHDAEPHGHTKGEATAWGARRGRASRCAWERRSGVGVAPHLRLLHLRMQPATEGRLVVREALRVRAEDRVLTCRVLDVDVRLLLLRVVKGMRAALLRGALPRVVGAVVLRAAKARDLLATAARAIVSWRATGPGHADAAARGRSGTAARGAAARRARLRGKRARVALRRDGHAPRDGGLVAAVEVELRRLVVVGTVVDPQRAAVRDWRRILDHVA
jgi:hypothetical protein